jgi:predicted ABC-class ATPase
MAQADFPSSTFDSRVRQVALRDYLARAFSSACRHSSSGRRGSGKSGLLAMEMPGQEILERSSVQVSEAFVEARLVAGLPAQGRRILGRQAVAMLCETLPQVVRATLLWSRLQQPRLLSHLDTAEDAQHLRLALASEDLVAFVADGSLLPRRSGVDDGPMAPSRAVPFQSPPELRRTFHLPHGGEVTGMGIPQGVTLLVGGGYHGKSTLLQALERGVFDHIPGDGRERVVADATAVKIRAEDGRRIERVDLRPFIQDLPSGADASAFCTENASGSTSQAANILEALEVGARVLLLDEDTCATNLMIRDARMQQLVEKSGEPITPFIDRVRQLYDHQGVSSILVLGGSGDYFDIADTVIRMDAYLPREVTADAHRIARLTPTGRVAEIEDEWPRLARRLPEPRSLDPRKGRREVSIKARSLRAVLFGVEEIDMTAVSQLVDEGQLRAIGRALNLARERFMRLGTDDVGQVVHGVVDAIHREGLDILDTQLCGDYVLFRPYELAAALNRLRTLTVRMPGEPA